MSSIVQIVTQMEAAGAQKVAHLLHESLLARGEAAELVFLYTKRPAYEGLPGISSLCDHPPSAADYLKISQRLFQKLRVLKPDIVVTHTHYANILGLPIAKAAGVRRRIAVHHNPLPSYPAAARFVDWFLGQMGTYSQMVAVSDAVVDTTKTYPSRYRSLLTRIYNGLPTQRFTLQDVRSRWNIPSDRRLILNIGRLSQQKNQQTLLRALQHIPHAHLVILGAGELAGELKDLTKQLAIQDRVCFTGELIPDDVYSFLQAAEVFVFPSLWEALPLAVIEAMQSGIPIVASDIPATRELLQDTALLTAPGDELALARAVSQVLADSTLAADLGARAKQRSQLFSAESMVAHYQQLMCA